jgi:HSP20 family molecular chaperone IbpA
MKNNNYSNDLTDIITKAFDILGFNDLDEEDVNEMTNKCMEKIANCKEAFCNCKEKAEQKGVELGKSISDLLESVGVKLEGPLGEPEVKCGKTVETYDSSTDNGKTYSKYSENFDNTDYHFDMIVAGYSADDLKVIINRNNHEMTIKGNSAVRGCNMKVLNEVIALPANIDFNTMKKTVKDGILHVDAKMIDNPPMDEVFSL